MEKEKNKIALGMIPELVLGSSTRAVTQGTTKQQASNTLKQVQGLSNRIQHKNVVVDRMGGFTLLKLLVVVLIIGILAAIALPQYQFAVEKARATEAMVNLKAVADALELYYLENGNYTTNLNSLDITVPELKHFQWRILAGLYISLQRKDNSYKLAVILKHLDPGTGMTSVSGRYSCDIASSDPNSTDSMAQKICKSLCGTHTLSKIWGSNEPGCEITYF